MTARLVLFWLTCGGLAPTLAQAAVIANPSVPNPTAHSYALFIGINHYGTGIPALRYAVSDARRLYTTLTSPHTGFCEPAHAVLMTTEVGTAAEAWPTRANILRQIARLGQRAGPRGRLLIYYAGHGLASGYLVPSDAVSGTSLVTASCLSLTEFCRQVRSYCPQGSRIIILDSCYSGAARNLGTPLYEVPESDRRTVLLTACGASEESQEIASVQAGAFSYLLNDALRGDGDNTPGGTVTTGEAMAFVKAQIRRLERTNLVAPQTPDLKPATASQVVLTHPNSPPGHPPVNWEQLPVQPCHALAPVLSYSVHVSSLGLNGEEQGDDPITIAEIEGRLVHDGFLLARQPSSENMQSSDTRPLGDYTLEIHGESTAQEVVSGFVTVRASVSAELFDAQQHLVEADSVTGDARAAVQESEATHQAYQSALDQLFTKLNPSFQAITATNNH